MIDKYKEASKDIMDMMSLLIKSINMMEEDERACKEKRAVNHPDHYQSKNGIEAIDVIESFNLNYNLGNAIKYILRSDKKGKSYEDIQKAIWYLNRECLNMKEQDSNVER